MKNLMDFIDENKRKVLIIFITVVILLILSVLFRKKEAVDNKSTAPSKTGWHAEHNPEFDDPNEDFSDFNLAEDQFVEEEQF